MEFNISSKLLDACVLSVLAEEDVYGYELTNKISLIVNVAETSLYPVLRRLLKDDLLSTYDVAHEGRNRKYYSLTKKGFIKLDYYYKEWEKHRDVVDTFLKRGEKL